MSKNVFVFVACGKRVHIETLQYSLLALKQYTRNEIIVVTDSSRNEVPLTHDNLIDITAPAGFDNHQASIYLKTGLHKFLPAENNYCYLDSDVVALDKCVDRIFEEFKAPVTFAKDHCLMDRFSPSAITCGCKKEFDEWEAELKGLFVQYKDLSRIPEDLDKKKVLLKKFDEIKKNKIAYALMSIRFWLARDKFKLDEDNYYDKKNFVWHDKNSRPVIFEKDVLDAIGTIESTTPYRCNRENTRIWTRNGKVVFDCRCNHLQEQIEKTFSIRITEPEWQHWNGGVFLFNQQSHSFLEAWHARTMKIFGLPEWKTRDQGTLIATAWEFGLQNHPVLSAKFNLIADYESRHLKHLGELQFKFDGKEEIIMPWFIHVYHRWADKNWDVWQAIEEKTGITFNFKS